MIIRAVAQRVQALLDKPCVDWEKREHMRRVRWHFLTKRLKEIQDGEKANISTDSDSEYCYSLDSSTSTFSPFMKYFISQYLKSLEKGSTNQQQQFFLRNFSSSLSSSSPSSSSSSSSSSFSSSSSPSPFQSMSLFFELLLSSNTIVANILDQLNILNKEVCNFTFFLHFFLFGVNFFFIYFFYIFYLCQMTDDPHPSTYLSSINSFNDFENSKRIMGMNESTVIEDDAGL
jgi:hypothetical protein